MSGQLEGSQPGSRPAGQAGRVQPVRRLAWVILAILLAAAGQFYFEAARPGGFNLPGSILGRVLNKFIPTGSDNALAAGAAFMVVAVVLWVKASGYVLAPQKPPKEAVQLGTSLRYLPTRRKIILLGGLGLSLLSTWVFAASGEDAFVRRAWLAGMLLIPAALLPGWGLKIRSENPDPSPAFRWQHILLLSLICAAGLWLRIYRLEVLPFNLHGDMASYGLAARDLLEGIQHNLFGSGWAGLPQLAFVPAAVSMKLFGNNLLGLRMSAVIGGTLCLPGLYLLAWRLFDSHRLAALAAAVLAVNVPHIHFSRIPAYMDPWPGSLLGAFLLIDGLRGRKPLSLVLAGIAFGLSLQMYYSGRVLLPFLALFLAYLLLFHRTWLGGNLEGLVLMAAAGLAAIGPSLVYFSLHMDILLERAREVWLYQADVMRHLMGKYGVSTPGGVLWEQAWRSLLMFNYTPDSSTQFGFNRALFHPLLAPLVVLGLGMLARRWKLAGAFFAAAWVLLTIILGSILTVDAPFWPRLVGILPVAALGGAAAMQAFIRFVEDACRPAGSSTLESPWMAARKIIENNEPGLSTDEAMHRATGTNSKIESGTWDGANTRRRSRDLRGSLPGWIATASLAGLVAAAGILGWGQYTRWVSSYANPAALLGRYLASLPPQVSACSLDPRLSVKVRETAFLAWQRPAHDIPLEADPVGTAACPPPAAWIYTAETVDRLAMVEAAFPGGFIQEHAGDGGIYVFSSYLVGLPDPG